METKLLYTSLVFLSMSILTLISIAILIKSKFNHQRELREAKIKAERELFRKILTEKEKHLLYVSQELHDIVGVKVFGLGLLLQSEETFRKLKEEAYAPLLIQELLMETNEIAQSIRSLSHEYQPRIGMGVSLQGALNNFIQRILESKKYNCQIHFSMSESAIEIDVYSANEIYRILCELIKNILQHADASKAELLLFPEKESVSIWVKDNGIGLANDPNTLQGTGLQNIQTRLSLYGGTMKIEPAANERGTCIFIEIPYLGTKEN